MTGYTKLFSSIIASTIWRSSDHTRLVWITMLAMADRHGVVEASVPGLADMSRVSVEQCRAALVELQEPDADSRSTEAEGRRIESVDGGWRLVNHGKYRDKMSADDRREYNRLYQQKRRKPVRNPVRTEVDMYALSRHTEAEADTEASQDVRTDSPEPPDGSTPTVRPLLCFDTVGAEKTFYLCEDQVSKWRTSYPALDVMAECHKAWSWLDANPTRRKTARGMPKFLVGWLNRATDSPRGARPSASGNMDVLAAFAARHQGEA